MGISGVVGNHVFAYDSSSEYRGQAFNFDRTSNNFSQVASFRLFRGNPGHVRPRSGGDSGRRAADLTLEGRRCHRGNRTTSSSSRAIRAVDHPRSAWALRPSAIIISPAKGARRRRAITKTAAPTTVTQGTTVTYTMVVTNSCPSSSSGVTVTDALPAGLTFVSATPSQGHLHLHHPNGDLATWELWQTAPRLPVSLAVTATAAGQLRTPRPSQKTRPIQILQMLLLLRPSPSTTRPSALFPPFSGPVPPGMGNGRRLATGVPASTPASNDIVCIDTPFAGTTVTLANSQQSVHSLTAASKLRAIQHYPLPLLSRWVPVPRFLKLPYVGAVPR